MKMNISQGYCIVFNDAYPYVDNAVYVSPPLNRGQNWNIVNGINTIRNQVCDFTGTELWSTNNFALVSWTQRTNVPNLTSGYSRDNLCEQQ